MTQSELTPLQLKAIEGLLQRGNVKAAAEYADCQRSTIHRYLKDPAFMAELRRRQRETLDMVVLALSQLAMGAAKAYRDGLQTDEEISTRLRAADAVLDRLVKLRYDLNIETRLEELEAAVNATQRA